MMLIIINTVLICSQTVSEVSDTSQPTSAVTSTGNESHHGGGASSHYSADKVWIERTWCIAGLRHPGNTHKNRLKNAGKNPHHA